MITAWVPFQRCWSNDSCPCLHSDPQFPDCSPGETVRARGWLSFHEGNDIENEFQRIEKTGWREGEREKKQRADKELKGPPAGGPFPQ